MQEQPNREQKSNVGSERDQRGVNQLESEELDDALIAPH
jgi:hypothetical protein